MTEILDDAPLSAAAVARLFGITVRSLWNWERAGVLVPIRVRKRRFYRRGDVLALLNTSAMPPGQLPNDMSYLPHNSDIGSR